MRRPEPLRLPSVILLMTAAAACAHKPPAKPNPYVADGVATIRAWMNQLPRCAPSAENIDGAVQRDVGATAAAVRGLLTLTTSPVCTKALCEGASGSGSESVCCNTCRPTWVVVPDGTAGSAREIAIQRSGETEPMSARAKDCALRPIREQIPKPEVVVSGWLEDEAGQSKIIRASICVVERKPAATTAATAP